MIRVTRKGDPWHRRGGELTSGGKRAKRGLIADDQSGTLSLKDLPLLEIGKKAGYGFARCPDHLCDFFVCQSQFEAWLLLLTLAISPAPLDEELGKLLGGGMGQAERAYLVAGNVVLFTELLSDLEACLGVLLEEAQKVFALDEIYLARVDRLSGEFVGLAGDGGAQPENLSGVGNFQDESFAIAGADGKLDASFAKDKNSARGLAFDEQDSTLGVCRCVLDGLERLQSGPGQIAENAIGAHLASETAFDNIQTVW